jgi:hypothetical protein
MVDCRNFARLQQRLGRLLGLAGGQDRDKAEKGESEGVHILPRSNTELCV